MPRQNAAPQKNLSKPLSHLKLFFKEQHILMTLLKEFRDGILICDRQGHILQLNTSLKTFLQWDDQVIGRRVADVISDNRFQDLLRSVLEEGGSRVEEITLASAARELFFEIHLVPVVLPLSTGKALSPNALLDLQGPPTQLDGCVIIFHNITDIRRTEKMRRDFVANVSHELRTPLSAIEGYSETLLEGAILDPAVCRDFIQVIHRHSLRLKQLVEDLLDLSKLESPDYKPELTPASLQGLIQQAIVLVEDKALEKHIHISVDIQEPLPRVMAESSSMQQVITNLLDNAIKYTPTHGHVRVSAFHADKADKAEHSSQESTNAENGHPKDLARTHTHKGKIQVDVHDNGIGIEAKYLSRVFERFYRVDKARSRDLGGTGLGLSIVKHIVQLHGGDLWVNSTVNQGSTFSFTLDPESLQT